MTVLILDESKKRASQIAEAIQKSKHEVIKMSASSELLARLEKSVPDRVLIDIESWNHGKSIYHYFHSGKKLEDTPVVFYNTPEEFSVIADRPRHGKDQIVGKTTGIEPIVEAFFKTL